jgi:hypothetical protein
MPLTYYERKARLYHGAVKDVAGEAGCSLAQVSQTLSGRSRDRDVETRLARLMRNPDGGRVTVCEAFGRPARKLRRNGAPLVGAT